MRKNLLPFYADNAGGIKAYCGRSDLREVVIHDGVTTKGKFDFAGCKSLMSFIIPDDIERIESCAFLDFRSNSITGQERNYFGSGSSALIIHERISDIASYFFEVWRIPEHYNSGRSEGRCRRSLKDCYFGRG